MAQALLVNPHMHLELYLHQRLPAILTMVVAKRLSSKSFDNHWILRYEAAHHVLCVEHLLGEFRHGECSVLLGSTGSERSESDHEEVQSWEWYQVDCHLSQVRVELTWESHAACDSRHSDGDKMVQVTVGWGGELKGSEADVI